ncbi:MAG: RtcB family protein [Myxococcota bacterium]
MKGRELANLGLVKAQIGEAMKLCKQARDAGWSKQQMREAVVKIVADPAAHGDMEIFGPLAELMREDPFEERAEPAPWRMWGEGLDEKAIAQMEHACRLPVARRGALMPDAHLGYGLPIGGVLATKGAVIPYAVGVDIACRMRLSVLDIPEGALEDARERQRLKDVLQQETAFGVGASFAKPREHEVLEQDWNITEVTQRVFGKGRAQLGSSGSGNHFVEYGVLTLEQADLGLAPGSYLAILSHSGSRGAGAAVATHYSKLARQLHPELPRELKHLAWLDMQAEAGQEYWAAMSLMGDYAAANHEVIHREMVRALGCDVLAMVENHHNFCFKELHDAEELLVHRKGATPAGEGVLGVIPGSMATPAYVVRGRGEESSLRSASHGAGRVMSRRKAKQTVRWAQVHEQLAERGVELLSAGLDEAPEVYKDINQVMAAQSDLVDIVARFMPKIVKMAPAGERPED